MDWDHDLGAACWNCHEESRLDYWSNLPPARTRKANCRALFNPTTQCIKETDDGKE